MDDVPKIRLQGKYLARAGFKPGTPIDVCVTKDRIVIANGHNSPLNKIRLEEVAGSENAKRVLEIALTGGHSVFVIHNHSIEAEQLQAIYHRHNPAGLWVNELPCPCGWLGDPHKACSCTAGEITRHQKRSAKAKDFFDLYVELPRVRVTQMFDKSRNEKEEALIKRVEKAKERPKPEELSEEAKALFKQAVSQMGLVTKQICDTKSVAGTIAQLAGSDKILPEHLAEALQYREREGF